MRSKNSSLILRPSSLHRGFTLVELLVVISIIAVLVGITIPIVGKVRKKAQESATRALLIQIESACQAYYTDFSAYPGPIAYGIMVQQTQAFDPGSDGLFDDINFSNEITKGAVSTGPTGVPANVLRFTGTENLVLGLAGGLESNNPADPANVKYRYNKDSLGMGPIRFNPKRPGRSNPYFQTDDGKGANSHLSAGHFMDDGGEAKDTVVPEFVDAFSDPMPLLYMRARKGGAANSQNNLTLTDNNIVTDQIGNAGQVGQYNLLEIAAYTQSNIGVGRTVKPSDYKNHLAPGTPHGLVSVDPNSTLGSKTSASRYPYDAYAYLTDPASNDATLTGSARLQKHRARKADQYILISAGVDRTYGTEDDITNFGDVLP